MHEAPYIAVGGGLAGAAFALELSRNGVPVVLLEGTRAPHHKVCGEFLSAEAQALLSYLGLDLAAMGATQISIFALANRKDCAKAPLPFHGAGLSRFRLDQALLEAAERQGAKVERGVQVMQIDAGDETVSVKTGSQVFRGQAAALATGKHNLRQYPRTASDMVGFKLQLRVTPDSLRRLEDVVQLVTFDGGYIGACIVEDRLVTVCWVLHRALLQRIGTSWPEQSEYFAQQSEILETLLHDAKPQWDKPVAVAGIPYGYLRRVPIASNIFPLGDQLAVIPSFTGDGMSIALYSGIAAAQAVLAGESAMQFQTQIVNHLLPQFRWAGVVNVLFEVRRLHGISVKLATAMPSLVTWIAQSTRLRGFEKSIEGPREGRRRSRP